MLLPDIDGPWTQVVTPADTESEAKLSVLLATPEGERGRRLDTRRGSCAG